MGQKGALLGKRVLVGLEGHLSQNTAEGGVNIPISIKGTILSEDVVTFARDALRGRNSWVYGIGRA